MDDTNLYGRKRTKLWFFDDVDYEEVNMTSCDFGVTYGKSSYYALAITNRIFEPYEGGNDYNINEAVLLLKESLDQGINFNLDNLLKHLPALPKNDTNE